LARLRRRLVTYKSEGVRDRLLFQTISVLAFLLGQTERQIRLVVNAANRQAVECCLRSVQTIRSSTRSEKSTALTSLVSLPTEIRSTPVAAMSRN
jgi:hypothetical protein